jgi:hypothetical protein
MTVKTVRSVMAVEATLPGERRENVSLKKFLIYTFNKSRRI